MKRRDIVARLILSPETLACLLLAWPLRMWLNRIGLYEVKSAPVDLFFILLLLGAVFTAGEYIRRALGVRSLLRDPPDGR